MDEGISAAARRLIEEAARYGRFAGREVIHPPDVRHEPPADAGGVRRGGRCRCDRVRRHGLRQLSSPIADDTDAVLSEHPREEAVDA
jgi:hypothetical protein